MELWKQIMEQLDVTKKDFRRMTNIGGTLTCCAYNHMTIIIDGWGCEGI